MDEPRDCKLAESSILLLPTAAYFELCTGLLFAGRQFGSLWTQAARYEAVHFGQTESTSIDSLLGIMAKAKVSKITHPALFAQTHENGGRFNWALAEECLRRLPRDNGASTTAIGRYLASLTLDQLALWFGGTQR